MLKKAALVVHAPYDKGEIFKTESPLNRDNCLIFFHFLKAEYEKQGFLLKTQDEHPIETADLVIYNEMPDILPSDPIKSQVILFESELIRPDNWDMNKHKYFSKIFTWHDEYVDDKKYFKNNFTHFGDFNFISYEKKTKFCTLIAGNKAVNHPFELYSKRVEAIRWFEKNHPEDFKFYGMGWGSYNFKIPILGRILNKLSFLRKAFAPKFSTYNGKVNSKLDTLKDFKYCIAYENICNVPGYITEKVFDSMIAGCIPVYWGAPNILKYIPEECLILKEHFKTYEELYSYMKAMSAIEYNARLEAIKKYLKSDSHRQFDPHFAAVQFVKNSLGAK